MKVAFPLALTLLAATGGCKAEKAAAPATQTPTNEAAPMIPAPLSDLVRADLLSAVADAASAYAVGTDDRQAQAALDGRTFDLTIRFGCHGPDKDALLGWSSDEGRTKIDVRATQTLALDPASLGSVGGEKVEAVEGFWVPRPWVQSEACPRTSAAPLASSDGKAPPIVPALAAKPPAIVPANALPEGDQSVGIARYYTATDSRTQRRAGRPYSATEKLDPPGALPREGIRLRIEGRLRAWPGGKVIRCTGEPGTRPSCVLSATIDRVAFERPEDGTVIAQWAD